MPELQKVLHSMQISIENSSNFTKHSIPNTGLLSKLFKMLLREFYRPGECVQWQLLYYIFLPNIVRKLL